MGKLNNIFNEGYNEYKSKENISIIKLANKYISKGKSLEKECDEKFNSLLNNMEKELKENNYSTSIINDLKKYYNSCKNIKKRELLKNL